MLTWRREYSYTDTHVSPCSDIYPALTFCLYNEYMFYFYALENEVGDLYFGSTKDLKRRLSEHQTGKVFSTKSHSWILIYYEAYRSETDARRRESRIKDHGAAKRQLKDRIRDSRLTKS